MRPASGFALFFREKQMADARFHPPVAAFRYQFVLPEEKYADFFARQSIFQAGKKGTGTEVIQTKVFMALRFV